MEKPRLFQVGSGRGSLALKEARPQGQGLGSSEHTEAASLRSHPLGLQETADHSRREGRADSLTRGPGPGGVWVTSGHPEPGALVLQPLPTSKAQAPSQTVYVSTKSAVL